MHASYYSLEPYTGHRTVIINIRIDMSRRMWLVPVSYSLDNRDKTILKKWTFNSRFTMITQCNKSNYVFYLVIIIKLCNVVFLHNSYIINYDFSIEI